MYQEITVIVNKGLAEDVMEAAMKAGTKGGTIIGARGSGIHETSRLFSMEIEPEKEIVLILAKTEKTPEIVYEIRKKLQLDLPGNGILFVSDVREAYGLIE
jgi:nitrogen regulatory protein PII